MVLGLGILDAPVEEVPVAVSAQSAPVGAEEVVEVEETVVMEVEVVSNQS